MTRALVRRACQHPDPRKGRGAWVSDSAGYELKYPGRPVADADLVADFAPVAAPSRFAAAGRSKLAGGIRGAARQVVAVADPPLAVATEDTFQEVHGLPVDSYTVARQALGDPRHQVIEAHELQAPR